MKRLKVSLASENVLFLYKSQHSVNSMYLSDILIRDSVGIFLFKKFLGQKVNF